MAATGKKGTPGTVPNQVPDYSVEQDDWPLRTRLVSPATETMNYRSQVHSYPGDGSDAGNGAIRKIVKSLPGSSGRR